VVRVEGLGVEEGEDEVAVEEPLEIRLDCEREGRRVRRVVSVTMRTPGHDRELAVGFLFSEGIVSGQGVISRVRGCGSGNVVRVVLEAGAEVDWGRLERHFYTTSSCGVCGKTSIEAVRVAGLGGEVSDGPEIEAAVVNRLPEVVREAQAVFNRSGGLHASALFDREGRLVDLFEDVGRHNALDKLVGARVLAGEVPLADRILLLSGRASFELVQKSAMAGIPIVAAVGAPSSLAVGLAKEHRITLLGFVRGNRFNVYSNFGRIRGVRVFPEVQIEKG
jgi:FdhD protein